MFFSSFFYERTVLSHLERVQQLPAQVQVDIAERVNSFISLARAVTSEPLLTRCVAVAMEEKAKSIAQGVNSTMDPRWAAPALAEAWCTARIGLVNGKLDRASAVFIISAIESFVSGRPTRGTPD